MKCFVKYSKFCDFPIENLPYGVFSTTNNVSNDRFTKYINTVKVICQKDKNDDYEKPFQCTNNC